LGILMVVDRQPNYSPRTNPPDRKERRQAAGVIAAVEQYAEPAACPTRFLNKATDSSVLMKLLLRKTTSLLVGVSITLLIALCSLGAGIQAQSATPPAIPSSPHLTLTAEQEYIIREIILKDVNVPKENSAPETIGDSVPETVKLYTLPSEIIEKVPPHEGCRLPLSIGLLPLPVDPIRMAMACFLRSAAITPASSLLRSSPSLSGASVLSASRLSALAPFPLHRRPGSHVPYQSLVELRAAYTPDAAWAVSGHPPS
jgi:hypothetical protein